MTRIPPQIRDIFLNEAILQVGRLYRAAGGGYKAATVGGALVAELFRMSAEEIVGVLNLLQAPVMEVPPWLD